MNAKQIIAITALAFAGSAATADDITIVEDNFVAAKTRAEVQAEVRQARAAGAAFVSEVDLSTTRPQARTSTLTRAEVQAEVRQARAAGEVFVSEVDLSTTRPQARTSTRTRAEVQAELRNGPRQTVMQFNPAA